MNANMPSRKLRDLILSFEMNSNFFERLWK